MGRGSFVSCWEFAAGQVSVDCRVFVDCGEFVDCQELVDSQPPVGC